MDAFIKQVNTVGFPIPLYLQADKNIENSDKTANVIKYASL